MFVVSFDNAPVFHVIYYYSNIWESKWSEMWYIGEQGIWYGVLGLGQYFFFTRYRYIYLKRECFKVFPSMFPFGSRHDYMFSRVFVTVTTI